MYNNEFFVYFLFYLYNHYIVIFFTLKISQNNFFLPHFFNTSIYKRYSW